MLSDVGIDVEIQSYESGTVLNMIDAGETELFIMGFGAVGFPEPDNKYLRSVPQQTDSDQEDWDFTKIQNLN